MREFELLAPAGNLEIFKTVIDAGADAVYFGGSMFSARAYANNLDYEDSKEALNYAHLHGKKAYLTLNTLVKNLEFDKELYNYIKFYYENGLDGFIVQDIGVIQYIRDNFPDMPVHGSTQMAVCNEYGAMLLKEMGLTRVVPTRELSLQEINNIYKKTGLEIEVFNHGALCYCYSGDCLMSSIIGGRSGNRGRCAQPCRLEYKVYEGQDMSRPINSKGDYVLSLKDLCGINDLQGMYDNGVCSLKIEGRMKQKQYAANVVNVYRGYIDKVLSGSDPTVSKADYNRLLDLGNRSGFTNSYYYHNTDNMVTFTKPSHTSKDIEYNYEEDKLALTAHFTARIGEPINIIVNYKDITTSVSGINCETASKRPVTIEDIGKRINKISNTSYQFSEITYDVDDNIFLPLGEVGRIRREAIEELTSILLEEYSRDNSKLDDPRDITTKTEAKTIAPTLITISDEEQLQALSRVDIGAIDITIDSTNGIISPEYIRDTVSGARVNKIYLRFPYVIRDDALKLLLDNIDSIREYDGYMVSSYDGLGFVRAHELEGVVIGGEHLYGFNNNAVSANNNLGVDFNSAPLELNGKELIHRDNSRSIITIYGRYPMMISANCINKNCLQCDKTPKELTLVDRKGHSFLVRNRCSVCYNVIYNDLPTCLFKERSMIDKADFAGLRIDFVDESIDQCVKVLELYKSSFIDGNRVNIEFEYTTGHFKRGVE